MEPKFPKMDPFEIFLKIGTWTNLRAENPKIKVPNPQKNVKTLKTHLKPLKSKCSDFAKNWHLGYFEDGKFNYEIYFP